jgi:hypothetical protein
MRHALAIAAALTLLALAPGAGAVTFKVKCKAVDTEQVKASKITVTRETGCSKGRQVIKHFILSGFNRTQSHLGYFCRWDTYGKHSRRGRCIAGKNGGIAFTATEKKLS